MSDFNKLMEKALTYFEDMTGEEPEAFLLGYLDYKVYKGSSVFKTNIQGIPVEKDEAEPEGMFIECDSKYYPYALLIESIIDYEAKNGVQPNHVSISRSFYTFFDYMFTTDQESYNSVTDCIIAIDDDQLDDIICSYNDNIANLTKDFKKILYSDLSVLGKKLGLEDEEDRMAINITRARDEEEKRSDKDKFIDWLLKDEDALLDAMEYVEDHEEEIDDGFDYLLKEMEFERYLKYRDKKGNDYYDYY